MADRRISELSVIPAVAGDDALAIVDTSLSETNKVSVEDLLRSAPAGTAAAPSIAFVDDPDTGFYRSTANELSISTGGSQRVVVDDAGNVGIGTSNPQRPLQIDAAVAAIRLKDTDTTSYTELIQDFGATQLNQVNGGDIRFGVDGEKMRIDSSGNVGIGVTTPQNYPGKLVVVGDGTVCDREFLSRVANTVANAERGFMQATDGAEKLHIYSPNDNSNVWEVGGTERMRITSTGNVGIGTSSPGYKFDILGGAENTYLRIRPNSTDAHISGLLFGDIGSAAPGQVNYSHVNDSLRFVANSLERMRIDSSGNVGIGTSSPGSKLVLRSTGSDHLRIEDNVGAGYDIVRNTSGGLLEFRGTQETFCGFTFSTTPTAGSLTERMRIRSNGVINFANCPTYADDTAAGTGGLVAGDVYKTSTGELRIKL